MESFKEDGMPAESGLPDHAEGSDTYDTHLLGTAKASISCQIEQTNKMSACTAQFSRFPRQRG